LKFVELELEKNNFLLFESEKNVFRKLVFEI